MFDSLGDGVFRRRYESMDLNIGVVIGEGGVLVVDTRASHRQADQLIDELATLTEMPVRWVVNTHMHWDHVWGNARFPQAEIIGHERTRTRLVEEGELARQAVLSFVPDDRKEEMEEVDIVPPGAVFAAVRTVDVGGRIVRLTHHGRAHTDCDIVVRIGGVIFAGDMVEEGAPPGFGDAFPLDWANTLDAVEFDAAETVVPGHGDVVDAAFVAGQRAEIAETARIVHEAWLKGRPADELPPGPYPPEVMTLAYERIAATAR